MGAALGVAVMGAAIAVIHGGHSSSVALVIAVAFTLVPLLPWLQCLEKLTADEFRKALGE
ncbi:MAG: hypothetical protein J0I66_00160 [Microbacterium sp.]|nr:hypothetical protein [Microbacterium sp.]